MFFMSRSACLLLLFCMFSLHVCYFYLACLLLLCCMLVTSLVHVILVVSIRYCSRIYHYIFSLFTDSLCTRVSICFISMQSLLAWPSFICTPLESIPQTYTHSSLSTVFFRSVSLVVYDCIYSVEWTVQPNVLVCQSFFSDGRCMFPITYHCCYSFTTPNLLFPVISIGMSIRSIINSSSFFLVITS
jgi:hypothetical protein